MPWLFQENQAGPRQTSWPKLQPRKLGSADLTEKPHHRNGNARPVGHIMDSAGHPQGQAH